MEFFFWKNNFIKNLGKILETAIFFLSTLWQGVGAESKLAEESIFLDVESEHPPPKLRSPEWMSKCFYQKKCCCCHGILYFETYRVILQ